MPDRMIERDGEQAVLLAADGAPIASEQDAVDLVGLAYGNDVDRLVIPVERFDARFFDLRTGVAGRITQKFVDYRLRVTVVGDISAHVTASTAVRDWVVECNRGTRLRFEEA